MQICNPLNSKTKNREKYDKSQDWLLLCDEQDSILASRDKNAELI